MTGVALPVRVLPPLASARRAARLVERNARVYRRGWYFIVSGFFEPLFYLLSIGVGVGGLVGDLPGPAGAVDYTAYVAPALLATSAMNGAVFDATFNVFFKLKYAKTYDAVLATPLSPADVALAEVAWALLRGTLYAVAFVAVMLALGLVESAWAVLAVPAAMLVGFAFAAAGMAATTYLRSWQDFEFVTLVTLPLFLFSATFYPLSTYPGPLQVVVRFSPLYQGVALLRDLTLGGVGWLDLVHVAALAALGVAGLVVSGRRLSVLLQR